MVRFDLHGHGDGVHGLLVASLAGADHGRVEVRLPGVFEHLQLDAQLRQLQVDVGVVLGEIAQLLENLVGLAEIVLLQVEAAQLGVVLLGLVDDPLFHEQVGQDLGVFEAVGIGPDDLAVDGDRPAVEALVDETLGGPLEIIDGDLVPPEAEVQVADGVHEVGVGRFLLEDLLVFLDGVVELAAGNELLSVLEEFFLIEGDHSRQPRSPA